MKRKLLTHFLHFALLLSFANIANAQLKQSIKEAEKQNRNTKIEYIPNQGQFNKDVLFAFYSETGPVYITREKIQFVAYNKSENEGAHRWNLIFENSNSNFKIHTTGISKTEYNYFQDADSKNWVSGIHSVEEIILQDIYDGIDLRFYSNPNKSLALEYDFIIHPGADYKQIKMRFDGLDDYKITKKGALEAKLRFGKVVYAIPATYQPNNNNLLITKFKIKKDNSFQFALNEKNIDKNKPLIIDPSVLWGTYVDNNSSTFDSYAYGSITNDCGEQYVCGFHNGSLASAYYSATGYDQNARTNKDLCVYKFSSNGSDIENFTYLGTGGSVDHFLTDIDIFPNGDIIVVGQFRGTASTYPLVNEFMNTTNVTSPAGVVTVLAANLGSLKYSSFLTGDNSGAVRTVAVQDNGIYYVGGEINDPVGATSIFHTHVNATADNTRNVDEGFVARFSGSNYNVKDWISYVGGTGAESLTSVKLTPDKTKVVFAGKSLSSSSFPALVNPVDNTFDNSGVNYEGFIGVFEAISTPPTSFSMLTYLGIAQEEGLSVIADNNYIYCMGETSSSAMPGATAGAYDNSFNGLKDIFVSRIPLNGSLGSGFKTTYLGGADNERAGNLILLNDGNIGFFGASYDSGVFPTVNTTPASAYYSNTNAGGYDIVFGTLKSDMTQLLFSTYMGGSSDDYLGLNGIPQGDGHLSYNKYSGALSLATTTHSNDIPNSVIKNAFDNTGSSGGNDKHLILKMIIGDDFDYGDAPDSYDTQAASPTFNPARHKVVLPSTINLGISSATVDIEGVKQTSIVANGDDLLDVVNGCTNVIDDEASSNPTIIKIDKNFTLSVNIYKTIAGTATLNGWIDLNKNGKFESFEYATATTTSTAGTSTLNLTWNLTALTCGTDIITGSTFMRLRFTNSATLSDNMATTDIDERSIGVENNGEVEDYQVTILGFDSGDLTIASYGTPKAYVNVDENNDNVPDAIGSIWLGSVVDYETNCNNLGNIDANADDLGNIDDEDGLGSQTSVFTPGQPYIFDIMANSNGSQTVQVGLWIDWDNNGSFEDFYNTTINTSSPAIGSISTNPPIGASNNFAYRVAVRSGSAFSSTDYAVEIINGEYEDGKGPLTAILPVTLLSFNGNIINKQSELTWITNNEQNNDYFSVQRSNDGIQFIEVGKVKGAGNTSSQKLYKFTDANPLVGKNYYRLQQYDFDGTKKTSNTIELILKSTKIQVTALQPNPTENIFNAIIFSPIDQEAKIEITDIFGKVVLQNAVQLYQENNNAFQFNVSNLSKGTYLFSVRNQSESSTMKLIIK